MGRNVHKVKSGSSVGDQGGLRKRARRRPGRNSSNRRLQFEPLESRQLLAGDLAARFEFADLGGNVLPSLQVGQEFQLRLYVQDIRSDPQGVFQAYFDVNYPSSLVSANGTISHGPEYSAAGTTSGDLDTPGLIDDVGGQDTNQFRPTPLNAELLLFSAPLRADQVGTVTLTVGEADRADRIVQFFDTVQGLPLNKIDLRGPGFGQQPPMEIVNPNATLLAIAATDAERPEGNSGNAPFTFTVTRSGVTTGSTTVDYAVAGTGANPANAADFGGTLPGGQISFAAGETSQTITVNVSGDTTIEPDEGFSITLSNASGDAQITTAAAIGTIDNDDVALAIAAADAAQPEGNSGSTALTFTVTRTGLLTGTTTASYAVTGSGGTPANAADFGGTLPSGAVSFASGETAKTITVSVSGDAAVESDEGFSVTLSNASGGATITTATASGTIANDDTALQIAATDAVKFEGNSGSTPFTFTVTRTGLTTGTTTANYAVTGNGTNPANAADFGGTLPSGQVSFAAGETNKTITVNVSGDAVIEPNEDFSVTLSNASAGAQITTETAAGTILDEDIAWAIAATDANRAEGNSGSTAFTFTVTRDGLTTGTTTVSYAVTGSGVNPANAADFGGTLPSGTVNFAAGEISKTITVNVSGDTAVEPDEGFSVTLSNASGEAQITSPSAGGTILNDDTLLAIAAADAAKGEGNSGSTPLMFTVTRIGLTTGTTTVNYAVTGSEPNPANAADFGGTLPGGTVSFAAGETAKTITVSVSGDTAAEPDEGFSVTLSNASGGAQIATATAIGTIQNDDTGLAIAAADAVKAEGDSGNASFTFTVTRDGTASGTTTVDYAVTGTGSHPADAADFGGTLPSGIVSFAAGETSKTVSVTVSGDKAVERDEGFSVTLSNASGGGQITIPAASGTIVNDDTALAIAAADAAKAEGNTGNTAFTFTVTRTGLTTGTTAMNYTVAGSGTNAADAADFGGTLPDGTVSFAAGEASKTIIVNVRGDTAVEPDESFSVTLSDATDGAQLATATAGGTIANDDTVLTIAAADATKPEGNAGSTAFTFTLTRTGLTAGTTTVDYAVAGTGASPAGAADFGGTLTGGTVSFAAGETSKTLTVNVSGDTTVEADEGFTVTLENASGGTQIVTPAAVGSIVNDDAAVVNITGPLPTDEGNAGTAPAEFTVTLSAPVDVPVSVDYATTDGTAQDENGEHDYQSAQGTLTFLPGGELTQTVTVAVRGDAVLEPDETFQVVLGNLQAGTPARNVSLGDDAAIATIADDDAARLTIVVTQHAAEDATHGLFTVNIDKLLSQPIQLTLAVSGTATPDADYVALSTTLTFPADTPSVTVPLTVLPDALIEGEETVIVRIVATSDPAARPGAPDSATLTIADEDATTVSIAASDDAAAEPADGGEFVVSLAGDKLAPPQGILVSYTVSGSAAAGEDYTALPGSVLIPAGQTSAPISLPVLDDSVVEPTETVIVTLLGTDNAGTNVDAGSDTATISIQSDDTAEVSIAKDRDGSEEEIPVNGKFRVTQTQTSATDTVLQYTVTGPAVAGEDYTPLSGTVTIPAGAFDADIEVAVLDDDLVEATETVSVTLTGITSGTPGVSLDSAAQTASLDIVDNDTATLSIAKVNDGAEADVPADGRFRVRQSKASTTDTVVSYQVAGTATPGDADDYTPLAGTVTIAAGQTTADIVVQVLNDLLVEQTETVVLTLAAVTSGDTDISIDQTNKTATVSILDEITAVSITASDAAASEPGADQGQFLVVLAGGRQAPPGGIQVSYTVSGDATPGADYTALSGVATIPAGQSSVAIFVAVVDDNVVELPEPVTVTLTGVNHPNVAIDSEANQDTVTINDDDPTTVSLTASDDSGSEPGSDDGEFAVTLGGGRVAPETGIAVSYTVSGTASGGADYVALSGTVTIPAGASSATILVDVLDDDVVELPETVHLALTGTNHPGVTVAATAATATVTIDSTEDNTTVSISATDATGREPGTDDAQFTVTLVGGKVAPAGGIVVNYSIGGGATAGSDYTTLPGTVTIPAGASSATIAVDVLDDNVVESAETVSVTLAGTNNAGAAIGATNNTATATIQDDDPTTVSISASDANAAEPSDSGQFTVALNNGKVAPPEGITVSYTSAGTATAGSDFAALTGTATIPAGASSTTIQVAVLDDNVVEVPETVIVTLTGTNNTGVTVGTANNTATVTITDYPTTVSIAASDATGSEPGTDDGLLTVTLDNGKVAPTGGIAVTYTVAGNATAGTDYTTLPGTVTILPGQSSATITVDVLDDNVVEAAETVEVTLTGTNHAGATIHATNKTATVTIDSTEDNATVSIAATDATGSEPGTDDAQFTVTLSGGKIAPAGGIVVNYTIGGTATAGSDYTALTGSVTIPTGASSATITVDVLADNVVETSETVVVALTGTNHAGATVAATGVTATVAIADDDATTVSITASDATAGEPSNNGQFSVTLDNDKVAPAGGIVVTYTTAGSATSGSDYTALAGTVTIPAGASSAIIAVNVIDDTTADEPAETVVVTLTSADHPSVTLSTDNRSATVTIAADDLRNASISGLVWIDADNDHQQKKETSGNVLEPGIPGVIVRLSGTARDGITLALEAMTDDDGAYRFVDLPAGTYEIREEQPAAWIDGQEMLTSSTVNDAYSNLVLTPGQQAVDYSFGERTLQPQFVSKRQFLASTPATDVYLRTVNTLAKQRAGDADGAKAIREASIPSEVSANSTASAPLTQNASLAEASGEASGEASDEASDVLTSVATDAAELAAGEAAPETVAPETVAPEGEGEAAVPPAAAAMPPVRKTAAWQVAPPAETASVATASDYAAQSVSRAAPAIATGSGSRSRVASIHAGPPPAAMLVGTESPDARHPVLPAGSLRREPAVARGEGNRLAPVAVQAADRTAARGSQFAFSRGTEDRETEENPETAKLVDLVFAKDAWWDGQGSRSD